MTAGHCTDQGTDPALLPTGELQGHFLSMPMNSENGVTEGEGSKESRQETEDPVEPVGDRTSVYAPATGLVRCSPSGCFLLIVNCDSPWGQAPWSSHSFCRLLSFFMRVLCPVVMEAQPSALHLTMS